MVANPLTNIPANHIMAVFNSQNGALAVLRELREQGFEEAILFGAEETPVLANTQDGEAGAMEAVVKAAGDQLSEESNYLGQYQKEMRSGNPVIAVPVTGQEESVPVQELLEKHGAHNVRFFGRLAVTDLTPDSNPSSRST